MTMLDKLLDLDPTVMAHTFPALNAALEKLVTDEKAEARATIAELGKRIAELEANPCRCYACHTNAMLIDVRTTNGKLVICGNCLNDLNRKNPRLREVEAERDAVRRTLESWRSQAERLDSICLSLSELRAVLYQPPAPAVLVWWEEPDCHGNTAWKGFRPGRDRHDYIVQHVMRRNIPMWTVGATDTEYNTVEAAKAWCVEDCEARAKEGRSAT